MKSHDQILSIKLSLDIVQCLFCHLLHFCAVAVHIFHKGCSKVSLNCHPFGNSRDYKIPAISGKLTQDLHFHCFLANMHQVWPRETPTFSLGKKVYFFPTLTASPLPFLSGRGTASFLQTCEQDLLFWTPTLPPWNISSDHSGLTVSSAPVLCAPLWEVTFFWR